MKYALVTGGSRGIGRAVSCKLAEMGYFILINYQNNDAEAEKTLQLVQEKGSNGELMKFDVTDPAAITLALGNWASQHPDEYIEVLINNAGISSEVYFLDATEEMFDQMTAIDWKGVYFCSQFVAKKMIEHQTKGVIVNLASNQVDGCWPRATIYAPTKAAVAKFTKNAAMELIPYNIRMVAIAPGYTDVGWQKGDIRLEAAKKLPMRRFATTKEIAAGVLYLISDEAAYMTGSMLTIDGGATLPVTAANDFE